MPVAVVCYCHGIQVQLKLSAVDDKNYLTDAVLGLKSALTQMQKMHIRINLINKINDLSALTLNVVFKYVCLKSISQTTLAFNPYCYNDAFYC